MLSTFSFRMDGFSPAVGAIALLTAMLVAVPAAPVTAAQDEVGSIIGAVLDELGGVLPGATVTVEHGGTR